MEVLVITPVKDSLETTQKTIEAVCRSVGEFHYLVFNDFSQKETRAYLEETSNLFGFYRPWGVKKTAITTTSSVCAIPGSSAMPVNY